MRVVVGQDGIVVTQLVVNDAHDANTQDEDVIHKMTSNVL